MALVAPRRGTPGRRGSDRRRRRRRRRTAVRDGAGQAGCRAGGQAGGWVTVAVDRRVRSTALTAGTWRRRPGCTDPRSDLRTHAHRA